MPLKTNSISTDDTENFIAFGTNCFHVWKLGGRVDDALT